jgi:hypothetical protein
MAENEILDIKWGQSFKATRRLLDRRGATASEFASRLRDDSRHVVARNLHKALQNGASLLILLDAHRSSEVELRAAVKNFPVGQLARIVEVACKRSRTKDPAEVARITASILVEKHIDTVNAMMIASEGWRDQARRRGAMAALEQQREEWCDSIATNLERSLRGEQVKWTRRSALGERVTAPILVGRSLLAKGASSNARKP